MAQLSTILKTVAYGLVAGVALFPTACGTDRDPLNTTTVQCTGTPTYDCSYKDCPSIPGCVAPEHVNCVETGELTPCEALTADLCEESSVGCYYEDGSDNGSCYQVDDVPDCAAIIDEGNCQHVGCSYSNGICTGTPRACESQRYFMGCTDLDYCWYTWGTSHCTGTRTPCSSMGTTCASATGCSWSACTGTPTACTSLDVSTCETQPGCKLGQTGTGGSGGKTSAETRCAGIPYLGCSSEGCATVLGCTPPATGNCENSADLGCEFQTTSTACASVSGCTYSTNGHCATSSYHPCFEGGPTETTCGSLPGCTWYSTDTCTEKSPQLTCDSGLSKTLCASVVGCTWDSASGCSGTPTPCSSFTADDGCGASFNCILQAAGCQGIPTNCGSLTSATCADSANCSWSTSPGCTGTPTACSPFTTAAGCGTIAHCRWYSMGLCAGTATPCRSLDELNCESQLGCYLKAP